MQHIVNLIQHIKNRMHEHHLHNYTYTQTENSVLIAPPIYVRLDRDYHIWGEIDLIKQTVTLADLRTIRRFLSKPLADPDSIDWLCRQFVAFESAPDQLQVEFTI